MIRLNRLNQDEIVINPSVVAYVERNPDTLITLLNGERIYVRQSIEEVINLTAAFFRRVASGSLQILSGRDT